MTDDLDGPQPEEGQSQRWDLGRTARDEALGRQHTAVEKHLRRARQRDPDATPADAVKTLELMYRSALTGTGAAVDATAAVPAIEAGRGETKLASRVWRSSVKHRRPVGAIPI